MLHQYKGYVETNGKAPIDKYKNGAKLKSLEEVKDCNSYAGVLADDAIVIDIDDSEQSEILARIVEDLQLDCIIRLTDRGRHFLFKNSGVESCGTHKKLACGLTADIKVGKRNSTQQLKLDGKERFIEWDSDNVQPLPKWLFPVDSKIDFFNMKDGEGRNSALFGYILTLSVAGFSKDESRECIEIINKYILADPLSDDEIETITRDEAFPKDVFYNGKSFLHHNFATFLKNNNYIIRINGLLHIYKDGCYYPAMREIEAAMVRYLPGLKATQRNEVLKYLDIICPSDEPTADARFIAFNNGIYDLAEDKLIDFSPDIVITNKIPWDYKPEAYSKLADDTLNKIACGDAAIRLLLEEAVGYSFYRKNEMSIAFFLTGGGSNGKSTFLDLLGSVIGEKNRSALGLEELDERFSVATLGNKLINIGDDISDEFLQGRSLAVFKKIVSGNEIKAELKGQDAFFMKPYAKLFFSANSLPRTRSQGFEALKRRLVIIPFDAKFSKNDPDYDPDIVWKLKSPEVMEYMIQIGIKGLRKVLSDRHFTFCAKVEREIENYEIDNNPILFWLKDKDINTIVNQQTKDVYREYRVFCAENGFQEITLSGFSKKLKKYGLDIKRVRIGSELISIYVKG